jgi:rhodanese-related sulfurtransferase
MESALRQFEDKERRPFFAGYVVEHEGQARKLISILLMRTITREKLKKKLDGGGDFKLVNCLDEWQFRAKRIPGSILFESLQHALDTLDPKEEVIVYCSNCGCTASVLVYQRLSERGFLNLRHYAGGIADWEDAGYPLEGDRVELT